MCGASAELGAIDKGRAGSGVTVVGSRGGDEPREIRTRTTEEEGEDRDGSSADSGRSTSIWPVPLGVGSEIVERVMSLGCFIGKVVVVVSVGRLDKGAVGGEVEPHKM